MLAANEGNQVMPSEIAVLNGYRLVYNPDRPRAMHNTSGYDGYVYEHIEVAEKYLGRSLTGGEIVHHLDGNRANNRHENLLVLLRSQHARLHAWLGAVKIERLDGIGANSENPEISYCVVCGRTLQEKQKRCCCPEHSALVTRKVRRPTTVELREQLKTSKSMVALGKQYGVSDNAVKKWCKQYGLVWQRRARRKPSVESIHPEPKA